jgi:penicillin-binding protein 1A
MIKSPNKYRPDLPENVEKCRRRRDLILKLMYKRKVISKPEYKEAVASGIELKMKEGSIGEAPYFVENIRKYLEKKYGAHALYTSGLIVYSTLDLEYQKIAERASRKKLKYLQGIHNLKFATYYIRRKKEQWYYDMKNPEIIAKFDSIYPTLDTTVINKMPDSLQYGIVQSALVCLDNQNGAIRAMIGGRDFIESKFNRASQAWRQPGSAFKPFVYTTAIDNGETPVSIFYDQPIALETREGLWRPDNYSGVFDGPMPLRRALMLSKNLVTIQLQAHIGGARPIIKYAKKMGLNPYHLRAVPSLGIGSCEVLPVSITSAYSIFPNMGLRAKPYYIDKILDRNNVILEQYTPVIKETLSPRTSYIMCSMLRSVVHGGTGYKIVSEYNWNRKRDIGGKTGTTNDYSDAWFIGFSRQFTTSVWTGMDTRRSIGEGRTGAIAALPIWAEFMCSIHDSLDPIIPIKPFPRPAGIANRKICKGSYLIANSSCKKIYDEVFIAGSEPDTCNINHRSTKIRDLDPNIFRGRDPRKFLKTNKKDTTRPAVKTPLRF